MVRGRHGVTAPLVRPDRPGDLGQRTAAVIPVGQAPAWSRPRVRPHLDGCGLVRWRGHPGCLPTGAAPFRRSAGAGIDLVLSRPDGDRWVIEVKRTLVPTMGRGFYSGWADLAPRRGFVVYPGRQRYRLAEDVIAVGVTELVQELATREVSAPPRAGSVFQVGGKLRRCRGRGRYGTAC